MKQRILMLDIDGVLLSGRAMLLPGNEPLLEKRRVAVGQHSARDEALKAVFDPAAVALVNRICREADARIVVHSSWRKTIGDAARTKLIEQGITEDLLHEHWATPIRAFHRDEKASEIFGWLLEHRLTPDPGPRPHLDDAAEKAWYRGKCDTGYDVVAIDDEDLGHLTGAIQLLIDPFDGFSVADARKVLGLWRAEDRLLGIYAVVDAHWSRVVEAFDGDRVLAVEWLHTADRYGNSRARQLAGSLGDGKCQRIWAELEDASAQRLRHLQLEAEIQTSKADLTANRVRDAKEVGEDLRTDLEQWRTEGFDDGAWEAEHSPVISDQALAEFLHDEGKNLGMWLWAGAHVARAAVACIMDPKHADRIVAVLGADDAVIARSTAEEEIDRLAGVEVVVRNAVALMRAAGLDAALDELRHQLAPEE